MIGSTDLLIGAEPTAVAQDSRAQAIRRRRNTFRTYPAPTEPMGKMPGAWFLESGLDQHVPPSLKVFVDWFEQEPDARERFRWALRDSLDELLDGQRTGRWAYQHLSKTEKTYLGTAVEVNLTKEFEFAGGDDLDWKIAGHDIDCKFSKDLGHWEIPMEMYLCDDHDGRQGKANQAALLTWFDDTTSRWAAGLIRITDESLWWRLDKDGNTVRGYNRDNKRRLAESSAGAVYWLWGGLQTDLPRNLLLQMAPDARERILSPELSGQKRVDQLFRAIQGQIVGRRTVLTVAQQDDAPKRVRDARTVLRREGVLILGHQDAHPAIAAALGLPVPIKGEWIAVRIAPVTETDGRPFFEMHGRRWARARDDDPVENLRMDYRYFK
ncbi:NaeI family type II restriction endonuclease [[Mycobacterium] kokjensenii]|uniref:NaeI family type II restriction endonuclease n=1 Tax=[Mycobacterium] kokjensenii TaxID=3064287 RepID=A0ABM9L7H5_9MYCO|nr:NaeI family type II restriction endonuclease [Mycolicibacter sp. MU0083]CAJ1493878.1 NaeI family type II restriction endonuclease [Mycolicibacter sp. MU0083]